MTTLEKKVTEYQRKGWVLLSYTENAAQLRRPKKGFSCLPNLLCTVLFFVGLGVFQDHPGWGVLLVIVGALYPVLYFLDYIVARMGKEKIISLFVDERGNVQAT